MTLLEKIKRHEARVTVIGIGYVGLPLVVEVARAGFAVTGYDKSEEKVRAAAAGRSYIKDIKDSDLQPLLHKGLITTTADPECLAKADVVIICVPTPLNKSKDPDNS